MLSSTPAGDVTATCANGAVASGGVASGALRYWVSPKPGYRIDDRENPRPGVSTVWLESDGADDILVTIDCTSGSPVVSSRPEADDHGGDDDRGDDDNSGPGHGGGDDDNSGPGGGDD